MEGAEGKKSTYTAWQKAILVGCLLVALVGTLLVIGGMVKISAVIADYGGSVGAPFFLVFLTGMLSIWLFTASVALMVYVARTNQEISSWIKGGPSRDPRSPQQDG